MQGWTGETPTQTVECAALATALLQFRVTPPPRPVRRARIAADLRVDNSYFGQQAEALVEVV